jgi:DNA-binding NtrC family response regulator
LHPTILLVDDDPAVLLLLSRIMHKLAEGYDVISVPDGTTALAQIAQRPIACVITDYRMPDMDGVALTAAIKAAVPTCPVILISGHLPPEIEHHAGVVGVDFFLHKPFPLAQLDTVVRAALAL